MPGFAPTYPWIENLPLAGVVLDAELRPQEWNEAFDGLLTSLAPDSDAAATRQSLARQVMSQLGACPNAPDLIVSISTGAEARVQMRAWNSPIPKTPPGSGTSLLLLAPLASRSPDIPAGRERIAPSADGSHDRQHLLQGLEFPLRED